MWLVSVVPERQLNENVTVLLNNGCKTKYIAKKLIHQISIGLVLLWKLIKTYEGRF